MDEKIIAKPLFFLGFFDTSRKSLEALGNALGDPLGTPWGALGEPLGTPGEPLGTPGEALGTPWEALGMPWEAFWDAWPGPVFATKADGHPVVANKANARGAKREASNRNNLI